jgi:hypothetical protein
MGFRVNIDEMSEKAFKHVSKEPGGRLAYLNRFPEAIQWIENPSQVEQAVALGMLDDKGFIVPAFGLNIESVVKHIGLLDPDIAFIVCGTTQEIPNLHLYSPAIQKRALERVPGRIKQLPNPPESLRLMVASRCASAPEVMKHLEWSEAVKMRMVQTHGENIGWIENPSFELMKKAVRKNGDHLELIDNPPDEIIEIAIRRSGMAIQYVKNPSEKLQRLAIAKCAQAISVIDNPLEELQIAAVTKSPNLICRMKNPCEEAMWVALNKKPKLIKGMKHATPEMETYAALVK